MKSFYSLTLKLVNMQKIKHVIFMIIKSQLKAIYISLYKSLTCASLNVNVYQLNPLIYFRNYINFYLTCIKKKNEWIEEKERLTEPRSTSKRGALSPLNPFILNQFPFFYQISDPTHYFNHKSICLTQGSQLMATTVNHPPHESQRIIFSNYISLN
jgi:hypothetical protein